MTATAIATPARGNSRYGRSLLVTVLQLAIWFAAVTGLVEGCGLLLFQRINWANWGRTEHVSLPILWVSPLWDLAWFLPVAVLVALAGRIVPRIPAVRATFFVLAVLMFYDWLALAQRLVHRSALILAFGLAVILFRMCKRHEEWCLQFLARRLPWAAGVVVLVWALVQGTSWAAEKLATSRLSASKPGAPNVVIMVVDTLRADRLSAYGYSRPTSPNIDRIARQGVMFENAISDSSWTLPSHASLLSGRHSSEHEATDVKPPAGRALDNRYPTLAETFSRQGYRSGAFSANYIYFSRDLGFGRGFVHFEDYFHSVFDSFSRTLYGREMSRLVLKRDRVRRLLIRLGFPGIDELQPNSKTSWMVRKRAAEVNREALDWIDRDSTRPFFVFMNYFDVHRLYSTPPGTPRKFVKLNTHAQYLDEFNSENPQNKSDAYDETVSYVDDNIGKFFDELKRRGLDRRTLVVITSDHGDLINEHGLFGHRNSLYMPLIRVPLIFWQPDHIAAGARVQTPVSTVLLAMTLSDFLGFPDASAYRGPSLKNLWTDDPDPVVPHPLSELARFKDEGPSFPSRYGAMKSVVTPQYHYMFHDQFGPQLYEWRRDPGETSDLSHTVDGRKTVAQFAAEVTERTARSR